MNLLFPDNSQRSPTAVSDGRGRACALCDKIVPFSDYGLRVTRGLVGASTESFVTDYCTECAPYVMVILPMAKLAREKALKGELL